MIKIESMSVLRFKDGADYLALYSQDMSMLSSLSTRHIVAAMPLPLKERSKFKKEVDVFYMGEPELAAKLQSVSAEPIENIPDLEGFLRSFEPFNDMGITSLTDIRLRRRLNATENLKKCREAANRRCNERESTLVPALFPTRIPSLSLSAQPTPRTHLRIAEYIKNNMSKGAEGMMAKVRASRTSCYEERSSKIERLATNLSQDRGKRFIYEQGFDPASKRASSSVRPVLAATAQDVLAPAQVSAAARPAAVLPQAPPLADRIQAQAAIRSRLLSSTAAGGASKRADAIRAAVAPQAARKPAPAQAIPRGQTPPPAPTLAEDALAARPSGRVMVE